MIHWPAARGSVCAADMRVLRLASYLHKLAEGRAGSSSRELKREVAAVVGVGVVVRVVVAAGDSTGAGAKLLAALLLFI